jgi:(p)ppGpp synthase/HD superfamily hydrolase
MFAAGIERALRVALSAHDGQFRKGRGEVPYVVHPIHAAFMLARLGADEATIEAAILHDVVEDCEDWTEERIAAEFGERTARIVADLTEDKSKTWEERKRWAVDHVPHMSSEAVAVKAADKLHNLTSLLVDLEDAEDPADVWKQFRGGRERTIRMAEELVGALTMRADPRLVQALDETLAAIVKVVGRAS